MDALGSWADIDSHTGLVATVKAVGRTSGHAGHGFETRPRKRASSIEACGIPMDTVAPCVLLPSVQRRSLRNTRQPPLLSQYLLVMDPNPYLERNTDPELIRRTGFDGGNRELQTMPARWARVLDARRATDAGWADRGRLGEAMRMAPSAGIAIADVAS